MGTEWRKSGQVYSLCCRERHFAGSPHLDLVDGWPATPNPKRARYNVLTAFSWLEDKYATK